MLSLIKMGKLPFEEHPGKIIVKKEGSTSPDYGKKPEERGIEELIDWGVINLNKPSGPTSHQVAAYVKGILKLDHVGHGGTLDPKVTGVLPIALEKARRIVQALLKSGKEYVCLMHIHKDVEENKLREVFEEFKGKIDQVPPVRSAVKRVKRQRRIYYLEILEIDGKDILFRMGCEAGTYVRKLCDDIGKRLGTGAHMAELVRTKAGPFNDKTWCSLHDLKDAYEFYKEGNGEELKKIILPVEKAVEHLPKIWIFDNAVDTVCHGADLKIPGISKFSSGINNGDMVAVMTLKNELVCLGEALKSSEEVEKEDKGITIKTKKVFMERGIYPKFSFQDKKD